ncbi:hypothetical protein EVG20_g3793 [Dentipellis fragilis]|uniref:Fucose-specific lectin n=1 Tax=Dentipellis fragilis TaxID=205917 RepID=A0A4Y9Z1H6_9AGAM|nr:hypothetical protein EVG20_g3793 [Dentipellis fragilis]
MSTVTGSTIAVVANRPGVTIYYRVGDVIQIYRKTIDGQASYDQDDPNLTTPWLKKSDSNIAVAKRAAGVDDKSARLFYQGSDGFLREIAIGSDGKANDGAISAIKNARAKTSLAAIVQNDADKPSTQKEMPVVLFYQGTDNKIYFVKSSKSESWGTPTAVDNSNAGHPGTTIQAYIGSETYADNMNIVYVSFLRTQNQYLYRYSTTVNNLLNSGSSFSLATPNFWFKDQSSTGRYANICVPRIYCHCSKDFRFYSQLTNSGRTIFEGIGQDGTVTTQVLTQGAFEQEGREYAQVSAVYQRTDQTHYAITVVFEETPRGISSVTLEGTWNQVIIVGGDEYNLRATQFQSGNWQGILGANPARKQLKDLQPGESTRDHGYVEDWNKPLSLGTGGKNVEEVLVPVFGEE